MIPLLLYAQATDLITFMLAVTALGIGGEINPLAHLLYGNAGLLGIAAFKAGIIGIVALAIVPLRKKRPRLFGGVAVFGIIFGSVGALANVASLAVSV